MTFCSLDVHEQDTVGALKQMNTGDPQPSECGVRGDLLFLADAQLDRWLTSSLPSSVFTSTSVSTPPGQ